MVRCLSLQCVRATVVAILPMLCEPAGALVGGASTLSNPGTRPVVMLVSDRGSFCTGVAIARDLVLTAAHCVLPGTNYKMIEFDAQRRPTMKDTTSIVRHPQFNLKTQLGHLATADVALVKLANPLAVTVAPLVGTRERVGVGETFVVHGYGLAVRGDGKTGGTLRTVTLTVTGKPGNLQVRLADPKTMGRSAGLGACTGDSGAPVFQETSGQLAVMGIVSWSTGPNNTGGCGGLTGVTPLELYRGWITENASALGSPLGR